MVTASFLLPIVLSGFILAIVIGFVHQYLGKAIGWVVALLPLTIFVALATLIEPISQHQLVQQQIAWVPSLNINLTFFVDGLSLLLGLIVSGVGTLIMIYAGGYLGGDARIGRFYVTILVFMAAMLGVVLSNNILLLFIFWELTSISSYMLIGFNHESDYSRNSARQALLVTGSGGLAMLAGLILLGNIAGSWELSAIIGMETAVHASPLYVPTLILILAGAFTKSAQFPFHFWLPNAMAAPTPVSAYLHSATMVKAGIYLLARLHPVLGHSDLWFFSLTGFGIVTAVIGAYLSWQQTDLKRIMAYSTISALGTLTMLLGLGLEIAVEAAMLFLLVHSLYKGALFMTAGAIDHETGTRDLRKLGGMARLMPYTMVGVALAALSMSGLPPMLGFISKELMYEATLKLETGQVLITSLTVLTNVFMVAAAAIVLIVPFFGKVTEETAKPHHAAPLSMWLGPVILGALALFFGLTSTSDLVEGGLIGPALSAVYGHEEEAHLGLWHGITPYLQLSILTVTLGVGLFFVHQRLRSTANRVDGIVSRFGPERIYEVGLAGLLDFADWVTHLLQNGRLRYYILFVIGTFVVLVGGTLAFINAFESLDSFSRITIYEAVIAISIIIGAFTVTVAKSRLFAVAGLGVVGYGIALLFVLFSAPDLAMTQFSIETLTVILFVLVIFRLPRFETISDWGSRIRDGVIAALFGLVMMLLVLSSTAVPNATQITEFFAANSYELAKGRNVVNVILVDFRGADTMVEVAVLAVAALGVYGLIRSRTNRRD
ncbi:MAG: putative monovalent cation/H+ antiporter subunit A [Chloroflexota bacterium]